MKKAVSLAVLYYLRFFAKKALARHRPTIVGIAGSVGKSSLRNSLFAILSRADKTIALSGNSESGIPLGILGLEIKDYTYKDWLVFLTKAPFRINNLKGVAYLVAEMGIDDPFPPKNMSYLLSIIKPDVAINLNVSATHTMQFEKALPDNVKKTTERLIDAIAYEDTKIITDSKAKVGIYNSSNKYITKYIDKFKSKNPEAQLLSFGRDKMDSIRLKSYSVNFKKTKFTFRLNEKTPKELTITLRDFCLPKVYAETFEAAILAARSLKIPLRTIQEGLEEDFNLPKGRASVFEGVKNTTIIDSTYNASKESMLAFLQLLEKLKRETKRPAVFVFGDMRELGAATEDEHRQVAEYAKNIANSIYCVGPLTHKYAIPIIKDSNKRIYKDSSKNAVQLGLHLKESLPENAIVLLKGSQNEIFLEEAVKFILKNPSDEKNLCRQTEYWKNLKANYFNVS